MLEQHVRRHRVVMPLDKKVFPLTTLSSSRKWSILSAAPLASELNLYYFLILLLVFLGIDTSPARPEEHSPVVSPAMPNPSKNGTPPCVQKASVYVLLVNFVILKVSNPLR